MDLEGGIRFEVTRFAVENGGADRIGGADEA
jgi:hypothetical protein